MVQALTGMDDEATILSVDAVGAYDTISRNAMFQGLADMVDGDELIPFIRQFHDSPSTFLWEDELVRHGKWFRVKGCEQRDLLMPLLFSLGQHRALVAVQAQLKEGERLFAFLADIFVVCSPARVGVVHTILEKALREKTGINIHQGKTKLWNKAGKPSMTDALTRAAPVVKPDAVVWRGDWALPPSQQGLKVLRVPIGHPSFITAHMAAKFKEQALLFERIHLIEDVQAGWLLLVFCAATRANHWLGTDPTRAHLRVCGTARSECVAVPQQHLADGRVASAHT